METPILHFISPPIPYFIDYGYAKYAPGEKHIHRSSIGVFDLIFVTKGALAMGEDEKEWYVKEGEMLILKPDSNHYGMAPCQAETEITWIHFQTFGSWREGHTMDECLEHQPSLIASHKQNAYLNHCDVSSIFIPKHMKLSKKATEDIGLFFHLEQEPKSMRNWKRQSTFQLFLQHLDRDLASLSDTTAIQLAEKIEWFIHRNYQRPLNNAMLHKELNYHPNYLAKNMLKVYGMTPMEYLQYYRIEQAKKLLVQTTWQIAKVAEEVGFQHVSYFSSYFVRREGISPSNFRRKFINAPYDSHPSVDRFRRL